MAARKKKSSSARRTLVPVVLLVALILSLVVLIFLRTEQGGRVARRAVQSLRSKEAEESPVKFGERLRLLASRLGARSEDVKVRPGGTLSPERWTVSVPRNQSLLKCNVAVTEAVLAAGGSVADAVEGISRDGSPYLQMKLSFGGKTTHTVIFKKSQEGAPVLRAFLAVVIDDLGYGNQSLVEEFLALNYPVTFSVLPGYRKSKRMAEEVLGSGKQLLLHLPMEPHGYPGIKPGKDPILVDLSGGEIRARVSKHLGGLPAVVGISNHMGSLATQDPEVMRAVLEETRERGLFFLDSKTTPSSVCDKVASEVGVACLSNDLFLDRLKNDEANV
ncbi:MAG: divergent polysaccharide deacetylase family protein, partial [Candidatus Eiseniibacteriota bacterium]